MNFAYRVVATSKTEGSDGLPLGNVRFFLPGTSLLKRMKFIGTLFIKTDLSDMKDLKVYVDWANLNKNKSITITTTTTFTTTTTTTREACPP